MEKHPDDKLVLYLSGELLPEDRDLIDSHLRKCNSCRSELDELKAGEILLSLYGRIANRKDVCPLPEKLSQFVDNNINDSEMDGLKDHIAKCSDCRKQVELLMQLNKEMSTIVTEESDNIVPLLPDSLRLSIRKKYPKVMKKRFFPAIHAATILIVIGFFLWFFKFNPVKEYQVAEKPQITFAPSSPIGVAPVTKKSRAEQKELIAKHNPNNKDISDVEQEKNKSIEDRLPLKNKQMKNVADGRNVQNYQAPIPLEEKTSSLSSDKTENGYDKIGPKTAGGVAKNLPRESQPNYMKQKKIVNMKADARMTIDIKPQMIEEELKTVFGLASVNVEVLIKDRADDTSYMQEDADQHKIRNDEPKHFEGDETNSKIERYANVHKEKNNKVREILVVTSESLTKEKQEAIRKYLNTFIPLNPLVDQVRFSVHHP